MMESGSNTGAEGRVAVRRDGLRLRVLRVLLHAYPAPFRREHGEPMLQAVRDGLADAGVGGSWGRFALWRRAAADVVAGGVRMRLRRIGGRIGFPPPGREPSNGLGSRLQRHLDVLRTDLAQALRSLVRSPLSTLTTIVLLGLAIGLTTLTFTVAYATTVRELPYERVDRIVEIDYWLERVDGRATGSSAFRAEKLGDLSSTFSAVGEFVEQQIPFDDGSGIHLVPGTQVSPGLFELLGVTPEIGRTFDKDDAVPGAPGTAILGHDLWTSRFQGSGDVLGTTVDIGGVAHTVIGVMPEGFGFSYYSRLWLPLNEQRLFAGSIDYGVVARLRDGATITQANVQLEALLPQLAAAGVRPFDEALDDRMQDWRFFLQAKPLGWERWEELGWRPYAALVPVGLALLVACANVAGLMLARGTARRHEMTLRVVLGGSRGRLVRQLLTEAGLIAGCAGVLGLLLVAWAAPLLQRTAEQVFDGAFPFGFGAVGIDSVVPAWMRLTPDGSVALFTGVVCALVVAVIGLVPAREGARPDLGAALRAGGYGATVDRRSRGWMKTLTVAQLALSIVLVIGASLTLQSAGMAASFDTAVDIDRVVDVRIGEPHRSPSAAAQDTRRADLKRRARELLDAHPDVESVSTVWYADPEMLQPRSANRLLDSSFVGVAAPPALQEQRGIFGRLVDADHLRTLGIEILRGRGIEERDLRAARRVAVVSESTARLGWPGADPIGREIRLAPDGPAYTVVGVVEDQRSLLGLSRPRSWRHVYVPATEVGMAPDYLLVRARADLVTLAEPIRRIVYGLDPTVPVTLQKLEGNQSLTLALLRWSTQLLAAIGISALALAAVGIFSIVSYVAACRTREMGLRCALGAGRSSIIRLVLRDALRLAIVGLVLGLALAAAVGQLVAGFFFGIVPFDPAAYAAVTLAILLIAMLAAWRPADRAARVDPAVALRQD